MTQQLRMPGTVTDAATAVALLKQDEKQKKAGRNARFEELFASQIRMYKLPAPYVGRTGKGKLTHQFYFAKDVGDTGIKPRNFAADFAWPQYKLLVEIQGGVWMRGGGAHSHPLDIQRDIERQQYATLLGYHVLPIMTDHVKSGHGIAWLQRVLATLGWSR